MAGGLRTDGAVCPGTAHPPGIDCFAVHTEATGRRDHRRVLTSTQSHQMMLFLSVRCSLGWGTHVTETFL